MTKEQFIEKWNVGYESLEQKAEFAEEMNSDLDSVIQQAIAEHETKWIKDNTFWFDKWNEKDPDEVKEIMDSEEYQNFISKLQT